MTIGSIREICLSFPAATSNIQWDNDLVFKIGGKMFAVISLDAVCKVSFKCTPEVFAELTEKNGIEPAAYAARFHWVTITKTGALPGRELASRLRESYDLVRMTLPKKVQRELETADTTPSPPKKRPQGTRKRIK